MIYTGNKADFTESTLRTMGAHQFTLRDGHSRLCLLCGIDLKVHISDWSRYETNVSGQTVLRNVNADMKNLVLSAIVDIIEADGVTYEVKPSNNLMWDRDAVGGTISSTSRWAGMLYDPDSCEVGFAQGIEHERLPNDGAGESGHVDTIFYHAMTPKVNGKINPADA